MLYEIDRVGERPDHAISGWTVNAIKNLSGQVFWCLVATPNVGVREEKDLFGSETLQSG